MTLTLNPLTPIDEDNPETWPRLMDTSRAASYLSQILGLVIEPQTLANYRASGRGPKWKYFGQKPLAARTELDRWVAEDALSDESPLRRRARARAERRAARAKTATATETTIRA
jgi:hypothetical protein